jgi:hypothetical protein
MISAMRRLGRALLRSSLARRTAALTVLLGLVGANTVMVTSTVYAATHGPGLLGSLGLGGDGDDQGDGQGISIPQAACQLLPALCQPGARLIQIPSGVVTLGQPAAPAAPAKPAPRHIRPHLAAPLTGGVCVLGLMGGCPPPKSSASPTATTSTTNSSTAPSSPSAPAATPTPSASASNCGLLGTGLLCTPSPVSGSSTGSPTPTPSPTAGLCLLSCNLVQLGGGCVASLLQTCVAPTSPTGGSGSSSGSGSGSTSQSTGACVADLVCLLGSSCTASVGTTCLLGALLPGLPGPSNGSPSGPSGPTGSPGGGSGSNGGSTAQGGSQPTGTVSSQGFIGVGIAPAGPSQPSAAGGGSSAPLTSQPPKGDESVGLVSGLSFGHGLILWPLFGLLDLAALAGLVVVVRRRWSATSS